MLFQPGVNFELDAPQEYFQHLVGSYNITASLAALKSSVDCEAHCAATGAEANYGHDHPPNPNIPDNFDARQKFTQCESIGQIYDQGSCKSDYVSK